MFQDKDPTRAERELLDTIERGARTPVGRTAVQLHLSHLLPGNRSQTHLRIAARLFAPLEISHQINVFPLSNGDIFVLGKDMPEDNVDNIVHRVRSLFDRDPLTFQDDDDDPFATWYAYEVDLNDLIAVARSLLDVAEINRKERMNAAAPLEPLQIGDLDDLRAKTLAMNIRPMLRRQATLLIHPGQTAEILFEEVTVGMTEVREAIAKGKDFFADRWLFQEFSRTLDQILLDTLPQAPMLDKPPALSVNVNLESINSRSFRGLLNCLTKSQRLIAEVQVVDVFTNLKAYKEARDTLRAEGHAILIDGLSAAVLGAMDLRLLDPDYVKILWTNDLREIQHPRKGDDLAALIRDLGSNRVILSRVESEQAMIWGLQQGITAFQGRFMDAILATVTINKCPSSSSCSMKDCAQRRASVMGQRRGDCPNPPWLDRVHTLSAPHLHQKSRRTPSRPAASPHWRSTGPSRG